MHVRGPLRSTMWFQKKYFLTFVFATADFACFIEAFIPRGISYPTTFLQKNDLHSNAIVTRKANSPLTRVYAFSDEDDEDEDDEDDGPLSKGIDSVSWLPSVKGKKGNGDVKITQKDSEILPLFPLGGIVYTPNSEHILNIFEPRYREMYSDILMNGTKRFVVSMSHPSESGRFAQVGVLFELQDLKEVSEQTADQIKYICNHKVTGRVKIHRILNPEAWESRDTYLRVEGTILDDSGKNLADSSSDDDGTIASDVAGSDPQEEKALKDAFAALVEIQHELEEDVRFTRASAMSLATRPGAGPDGLWQTIKLWQSFADQRLIARQNELQQDFQEKLQDFLKQEKGLKENELPSAISFQDLTPSLQKEVQELQKRMAVELKPLVLESTLTMQKILEAEDHNARVKLLRYFVEAETKRLNTKKALRGMFSSGSDSTSLSNIPVEERLRDEKSKEQPPVDQSSIYSDDEDAFQ